MQIKRSFTNTIILVVVISLFLSITTYASTNFSNLSWYSDESMVYYLQDAVDSGYAYWTVTYAAGSLSEKQKLNSAAVYAAGLWRNSLDYVTVSRYGAGATIEIVTGSYSELVDDYLMIFSRDDEVGWTYQPSDYTYSYSANNGNYIVNGISTDYSNMLIFVFGGDLTQTGYNNVVAHEFGHALGWYGHNNNSSSLMRSGWLSSWNTSSQSITNSDSEQIDQIYEALTN